MPSGISYRCFLGILFVAFSCRTALVGQSVYLKSSDYAGMDIVPVIEETINSGIRRIILSKGEFRLESLLEIDHVKQLKIVGHKARLVVEKVPTEQGPALLKIYKSDHFVLKGVDIICEPHLQSMDRLMHSIFIYDSHGLVFKDISITHSLGDGMQIASEVPPEGNFSNNIRIENCHISKSYRNALSLINCSDIRIRNSSFNASRGASPQAGIDIEPDIDSIRPGVFNVIIKRSVVHHNEGNGIALPYTGVPQEITIRKCSIMHNSSGVYTCGKNIRIIKNRIEGNRHYGISSIRYPEHNVPVDSTLVLRNRIVDNPLGIYYRGTGGLFLGNSIKGTLAEGIELRKGNEHFHSAVIRQNKIEKVLGQSAIASDFDKLEIRNNTIDNCKQNGISLHNGHNEVRSNHISNCSRYSILVNDATCNVIKNTIRDGGDTFIWFNGFDHLRTGGNIIDNRIYSEKSISGSYILDTCGRLSNYSHNILAVPVSAQYPVQLKHKPPLFEDKMNAVLIRDDQ